VRQRSSPPDAWLCRTAVVSRNKGRRTYDEAGRLQAPWANRLSEDLAIKDIDTTRRIVAELRKKLELNGERAST
jgi:predicted secreted protein